MGVNATAGKSMLAGYYHKGEGKEQEVIPALIMGAFPVVLGEPPGRCTVDPWRACCRCEGGDGPDTVAIMFGAASIPPRRFNGAIKVLGGAF